MLCTARPIKRRRPRCGSIASHRDHRDRPAVQDARARKARLRRAARAAVRLPRPLDVMRVRIVEMGPAAHRAHPHPGLLIADHRVAVRAGAGAGQPEVSDDRNCLPPDRDAAAVAATCRNFPRGASSIPPYRQRGPRPAGRRRLSASTAGRLVRSIFRRCRPMRHPKIAAQPSPIAPERDNVRSRTPTMIIAAIAVNSAPDAQQLLQAEPEPLAVGRMDSQVRHQVSADRSGREHQPSGEVIAIDERAKRIGALGFGARIPWTRPGAAARKMIAETPAAAPIIASARQNCRVLPPKPNTPRAIQKRQDAERHRRERGLRRHRIDRQPRPLTGVRQA